MIGAVHVVEHNAHVYRRTWQGSILSSFFSPLLFLSAMGIGLGALVNRNSGGVAGVSYLQFLAPGLLATTCMQTASFEMTFPIMGKVYWDRTYEAMLCTPLRVRDLLWGDNAWVALRVALVAVLFFVAMLIVGAARSWEALLAIPAAAATGMAFATPIYAYAVTQRRDTGFAVLQRFIIVPLFLFGGAFFPIAKLPLALQVIAWLTPLYHGVELTRGLVLGRIDLLGAFGHSAVLVLWIAAGLVVGSLTLRRRMVK